MTSVDEFLPLTAVAFEILLSLADGERHGYAVMRDVEGRTEGRLSLHPGTLYRAIGRLVDNGLLAELEGEATGSDARRRTYRLTDLGRSVAAAEAGRLEEQLGTARARRVLAGK